MFYHEYTDITSGQGSPCQLNEFSCLQTSNGSDDVCIPRWQVCDRHDNCGINTSTEDEKSYLCGANTRSFLYHTVHVRVLPVWCVLVSLTVDSSILRL